MSHKLAKLPALNVHLVPFQINMVRAAITVYQEIIKQPQRSVLLALQVLSQKCKQQNAQNALLDKFLIAARLVVATAMAVLMK